MTHRHRDGWANAARCSPTPDCSSFHSAVPSVLRLLRSTFNISAASHLLLLWYLISTTSRPILLVVCYVMAYRSSRNVDYDEAID